MYQKLLPNCSVKIKHAGIDSTLCCYVNKLAQLLPDPTCSAIYHYFLYYLFLITVLNQVQQEMKRSDTDCE